MTKSVTKIQDKDSLKRLSVVRSTEDPTKYGIVILNPDGSRIRGPKGETWRAATVSVWSTTTGNPWTSASVSNSGTEYDAILNFTIPRGATVTVGNTATGNPWTSASVTDSGTGWDVVLDFTIPRWDKGETGNGISSVTSSKSWKITTVTINFTDGSTPFTFQVSDGDGDVNWPISAVDGDVVLFDGTTWKLIKDGGSRRLYIITEDMITKTTTATKWVAPYNTSYYYTNLEINESSGVKWVEWAIYMFMWNTLTAGSSYRNVRIRIGATWNRMPLMSNAGVILAGNTYVAKSYVRPYTYSTRYEANGAVMAMYDANTTYSSMTTAEIDAWSWTSARSITPANLKYAIQKWDGNVVDDTAFANTWDWVTSTAPSKNAVYDKIKSIDDVIPSAATSSNQLADKNYVNDSINSVTAYYITKNAQGAQFATYSELANATTFYSGGVVRVPTKNDYTIVLDDENHDHATTRYIYNSGWEYQYTVNETALTQAQLDALNSWITSWKVSTYDGYASGKQDALTLPATPTSWHLVTWGANNKTLVDGWAVPTVPTNVSSFNNDAGYLTSSTWVTSVNGSNWAVTVNDIKASSSTPSNPTEWMAWYDTTNDVLKVYNGSSWDEVGSGSGDVSGPVSSTDGNITVFDGATGKLIKDSGVAVSDLNTKTFYLTGTTWTTNIEIAQAVLNWYNAGKNPIINYNSRTYFVDYYRTSADGRLWFVNVDDAYRDIWIYNIVINYSGDTVSSITSWANNATNTFLSKYNTSSYTPTSDYNPATKKYVDDKKSEISVTLPAQDWTWAWIDVTVSGVTASNTVIVSPAPSYISDYTSAWIYCSAQWTNSLTFDCTGDAPSTDIVVNVVILN